MFCRCVFAAVLCLVIAVGAAAAPATAGGGAAAPWHAQPTGRDVLRGSFTQRKYLAELEQPLVSTGRFVVAAGHGLLWRIEQPVQAQLVVTRQHMVQRSNGHEVVRFNAEQAPALSVVAAVLLAVFQADMDQLRHYFQIQKQSGHGDHWAMTLVPSGAGVGEFIAQVRIQGAANINRIEIDQPGGDRSIIELHAAVDGPATLSAQEQAQFLP